MLSNLSKKDGRLPITVRVNNSKRFFTLCFPHVKYRTCVFSKKEFEEMKYNTDNDWRAYLTYGDYYDVT